MDAQSNVAGAIPKMNDLTRNDSMNSTKSKVVNKIRCKHCDDVIESKHVHDFVTCMCGAVSVDGGPAYRRYLFPSFPPEDHFEVLEE